MNEPTIFERRRRVLGASPLFYEQPLHFVRGEGVHLYAADGRRYLDCYNNIPVVGHCNPHVVAAMANQARTLNVHSRYVSDVVVSYAERLLGTFKTGLDQMIFTCTGSEANDQALRIARALSAGRGIICTNYTYHGNTAAVDEVSPLFHPDANDFPEVRTIPFPQMYRPLVKGSEEEIADAYLAKVDEAIESFKRSGVGLAGIILCSIFANEGLPNVPRGFLAKACARVRSAGGMVIADEVQSGFGRTGVMWGHELMGFEPDLVTMGKPMGNGYPVAAVVGRTAMLDAFRSKVFYFNTFAGAPVAAATANAVLDVIEDERLMHNARIVGDRIRDGFRRMAGACSLIGDIRGMGLWIGVELVRDRQTLEPATEEAGRLVNLMKEAGALVSRIGPFDNVLKIRPPLIFNEENADELLAITESCLRQL